MANKTKKTSTPAALAKGQTPTNPQNVIDNLTHQLEAMKKEAAEQRALADLAVQESSTLTTKLGEANTNIGELTKKLAEMQQQLNDASNAFATEKVEHSKTRGDLTNANKAIATEKMEHSKTRGQLENEKLRNAGLGADNMELARDNIGLEGQNAAQADEIKKMQENASLAARLMADQAKTVSQLRDKNTSLEGEVKTAKDANTKQGEQHKKELDEAGKKAEADKVAALKEQDDKFQQVIAEAARQATAALAAKDKGHKVELGKHEKTITNLQDDLKKAKVAATTTQGEGTYKDSLNGFNGVLDNINTTIATVLPNMLPPLSFGAFSLTSILQVPTIFSHTSLSGQLMGSMVAFAATTTGTWAGVKFRDITRGKGLTNFCKGIGFLFGAGALMVVGHTSIGPSGIDLNNAWRATTSTLSRLVAQEASIPTTKEQPSATNVESKSSALPASWLKPAGYTCITKGEILVIEKGVPGARVEKLPAGAELNITDWTNLSKTSSPNYQNKADLTHPERPNKIYFAYVSGTENVCK